jgi:sec-independent protein translocase protein TatA
MPALGPWELIIVLVIVVVIFGAGRIADVGGALGKSVREFRGAVKSPEEKAAEKAAEDAARAPSTATAVPTVPAAPAVPAATVTTVTPVAPVATAPVEAAPAAVAENKCPSCATVNPPSQVFCGQCGTRLTRAA